MTGNDQLADATPGPARPFTIIAGQRTGSTLLVRSLDSSPLIYCAGEIFHDGTNVHHAEWRLAKASPAIRALDRLLGGRIQLSRIRRHLSAYFSSAGDSVRAVGFKVMTSQLRGIPGLLGLLQHLGVATLFLYRRDTFATAMSYAKARFSNVFHSDQAQDSTSPVSITVPQDEFTALLNRCRRAKQEILDLHRERGGTLLAYEEMVSDWNGVIESIGTVLDLPTLRVEQALEKLGRSENHTIVVNNEDELRRSFSVDPSI